MGGPAVRPRPRCGVLEIWGIQCRLWLKRSCPSARRVSNFSRRVAQGVLYFAQIYNLKDIG